MKSLIIPIIIAIVLVVGIFFFFQKSEDASKSIDEMENQINNGEQSESRPQADEAVNPKEESIQVVIKTERGDVVIELYPQIAPRTVESFVTLAKDGFYDGIKFHRVISDFMVQGGDPLSKTNDPRTGSGGPGYTFEDEINPRSLGLSEDIIEQLEAQGYVYDYTLESLLMDVGALAMANSGPNTNGSQFFIVTEQSQPHLNGKHTVFGAVVEGMDVVRAIEQGDMMTIVVIEKE